MAGRGSWGKIEFSHSSTRFLCINAMMTSNQLLNSKMLDGASLTKRRISIIALFPLTTSVTSEVWGIMLFFNVPSVNVPGNF